MIALRTLSALPLLAAGFIAMTSIAIRAEEMPVQDERLKEVVAGDHRSEENKARDKFRNPVETLSFFGIRPDMTVVEIYPGRGWYTEILAPYLKDSGTLYAAQRPSDPSYGPGQRAVEAFNQMMKDSPELYGDVKRTTLTNEGDMVLSGPADLVLTFRNTHSLMRRGAENEAFAAMFEALKPGGVLGVVQHRGDPSIEQDPKGGKGYVNEDYVIALAEKAGFELAEKSETNDNAKDTKDDAKGVWTVPPSLTLGDEDREKYMAIGESDRMTLKFVKPER